MIAAPTWCSCCPSAGMFGMFFLGALYLQRVLGYDPLRDRPGVPPHDPRRWACSRCGTRTGWRGASGPAQLVAGLALVALALALFARAPVGGQLPDRRAAGRCCCWASASAGRFPGLMTLAIERRTREDAGLASGLINTTAQAGGALGLAVLATVAAGRTEALASAGGTPLAALTGGYHLALWIAAGLVVAALVVTSTALTPRQGERGDELVPVLAG